MSICGAAKSSVLFVGLKKHILQLPTVVLLNVLALAFLSSFRGGGENKILGS